MKYIIELTFTDSGMDEIDYVGVGTYVVNHDRYAVLTTNPSEAKRSSSYGRAENAYFRMCGTCHNVTLANEYEILELNEEKS